MASEAAKNRALKRGPGFWGFWLAHHHREDLDRCYQFWLGSRPIWLCARCSGLIPAVLISFLLQMFWLPPLGWWDILLLGILPLPAFADWARSRWALDPGKNWIRSVTGLAFGISMGRSAAIHGLEAFHPWVVGQWIALLLAWALVELGSRLRRSRKEPQENEKA